MYDNDKNPQESKRSLREKVDEIEKSEEVLRKKLIKKVYLIIFSMIVTLISIIIIEFKEFSFNETNEYKIGKADLGPKDLVWAGIMGTPPSYYESDKKYGLGIKEFETREIRVALEEAGFNIIYRYMSPNRLEFEFIRKHPVCFYDRKWSNPKEYFKKSRPEILSIPLNYTGREAKKIIFRKEDRPRFEKHLDEKGNLVLSSLIKDTSLKTELVRAVNYDGPYARENITYGKKQLDGTYYDIIKDQYAKNIDLVILHTNDQILQMLGKKRFDYQFLDTLEYDDYIWINGGKNRIDSIIYEAPEIFTIENPNSVFHSVACGNHPLTKQALPIINEVIYDTRQNVEKHNRKVKYAKKLNPQTKFQIYTNSLLNTVVKNADIWYNYQFTHFNKSPWPFIPNNNISSFALQSQSVDLSTNHKSLPKWNLIEENLNNGRKQLLIIHDTVIKNKEEENILTIDFLEKINYKKTRIIKERNENFKNLDFSQLTNYNKIIVFAHGLRDKDLHLIINLYKNPNLKSITLIDGSLQHSKTLLNYINKNLEQLRLYNTPLVGTPVKQSILKLKKLKSIAIHAGEKANNRLYITNLELLSLINSLPQDLEEFSLSENIISVQHVAWFTDYFAQIFAFKNFNKLKLLQIKNFPIDEKSLKTILDFLPLSLESLIIGNSMLFCNISSLLLEEFLNKRYTINKLKTLKVSRLNFSLKSENKIILPKSLENLSITLSKGSLAKSFNRIIFHPDMRLKSLDLSQNDLPDAVLKKIFLYVNPSMENLILSNNRISGQIFINSRMNKNHYLEKIKYINNLKLDSNLINNQGLIYFWKLPWKIKKLDISNNLITDTSFSLISSKKMPELEEIDLSENYLNYKYINKYLKENFQYLTSLKLRNVLSLRIQDFFMYIPNKLEVLDLSGNLINDEQIIHLVKNLPKDLRILNISGSRMGIKGAIELSKKMPNLSQFFFDFKSFQDEKLGLQYLLNNLSPFLVQISPTTRPLSYSNAELFSKKFPSFLNEFVVPEFEMEECKILLSSFPNTLRTLTIRNDIKSKGKSLKLLSNNYPEQLLTINLGNNISFTEREQFFDDIKGKYIDLKNPINKEDFYHTLYKFGNFNTKYFKEFISSPILYLLRITPPEILTNFLLKTKSSQLKYIKYFLMGRTKNIGVNEIITFLKKLPNNTLAITLINLGLKLEDVDKIIDALPKNLERLNISENPFGEQGLKKFREFKRKMEEKTSLPFELVEETILN